MASWKNILEEKIRENSNITKEEAIKWVYDSHEFNFFSSDSTKNDEERDELLSIIESIFN